MRGVMRGGKVKGDWKIALADMINQTRTTALVDDLESAYEDLTLDAIDVTNSNFETT